MGEEAAVTLEEAIKILNRERHFGDDVWEACGNKAFFFLGDATTSLDGADAIAAAEKYERKRQP